MRSVSLKRKGALLLSILTVLSISSCFNKTNKVVVDETKSQLRVNYFNAGLGRRWLDEVCDDFEKAYASVSFENGKKGVQIIRDFVRKYVYAADVLTDQNEVFIQEDFDYYDFITQNACLDLTDIVKASPVKGPKDDSSSENELEGDKTIEDLLYPSSRNYYGLKKNGKANYYALPFYESSCNLQYDIDLFDKNNFYFKKGASADDLKKDERKNLATIQDLFISSPNEAKSAGPDGEIDTFDDGLPATYADFEALLCYMSKNNTTPVCWNGYERGYVTSLLLGAWAESVGYDQMSMNLSLEGVAEANSLLTLDPSTFKPNYDSKGNPNLIPNKTTISKENGYLLHSQRGVLDALNFAHSIIEDQDYWLARSKSSGFRHTDAQKFFVSDQNAARAGIKPIGMLIEGTWWHSEADFDAKAFSTPAEKQKRKFAPLPLPHPSKEKIGQGTVLVSDRDSGIFIRKNIDEKIKPIALDFVSFLHNHESLKTFSLKTDMLRYLEYDLSESELKEMNHYGRMVYAIGHNPKTKHLDWRAQTDFARSKKSLLSYRTYPFSYQKTDIDPLTHMSNGISVDDYFSSVYRYWSSNWDSWFLR